MSLPIQWLLFSHSQNAYWTGVEFDANPDNAQEYSSEADVYTSVENDMVAGGHYRAEKTVKRTYPSVINNNSNDK
jgi:hypothetical protein